MFHPRYTATLCSNTEDPDLIFVLGVLLERTFENQPNGKISLCKRHGTLDFEYLCLLLRSQLKLKRFCELIMWRLVQDEL